MAERRPQIMISLDASGVPRDALELVARLAASMNARMNGFFMEDENLLSLSHFSFVREVSFSGHVSSLDPQSMARDMRAQAAAARQMLERIAVEANLEWSFEILRSRAFETLTSGARAGDLLVVRSRTMESSDPGSMSAVAIRRLGANLLVISPNPGPAPRPREARRPPLIVAPDATTSFAFAETLARRMGAPLLPLSTREKNIAEVAVAARQVGAGLLVVNADMLGDDDMIARLSSIAGCPILILGMESAADPSSPQMQGDADR